MICGIGTDIVDIETFRDLLSRREQFLSRVFTAQEMELCGAAPFPYLHYAGRFAVKEAVKKALRCDTVRRIDWLEIEVVSAPGTPPPALHSTARPMNCSGIPVPDGCMFRSRIPISPQRLS